MGNEYTIKVPSESREKLDELFRAIPSFSGFRKAYESHEFRDYGSYEFRSDDNPNDMPDATAQIEKSGIYFCDHGGDGAKILNEIVNALRSIYDDVTLEELDN